MYKLVAIERVGDSVFKNETNFKDIKEAKEKYNEEKDNPNVVDIRLWYCVEIERFCRHNNMKDKK